MLVDVQIFLILGVGGSVTALAICRVSYGEDWHGPWLVLTKALAAFVLILVAGNERALIRVWWAAAPVLSSLGAISTVAWLITRWAVRRGPRETVLSLEPGDAPAGTPAPRIPSRVLLYWGLLSFGILAVSIVIAAIRIRP